MGVKINVFDESVHHDIIRGVRRLLPSKPDSRPAFLLPHYFLNPIFAKPQTPTQLLLKAAVIWGFLGMFRFATYGKLGIQNLVIVGREAREQQLLTGSASELRHFFEGKGAIGFYFTFPDKYHPVAHAFFSKLASISQFWSAYCPVQILIQLSEHGLISSNIFPKNKITNKVLRNYIRYLPTNPTSLDGNQFTPHSLRIGGHTFFSMKNMEVDFVHFLGRRAISRACQLYYRANAYDNIVRVDMFFRSIGSQHILQNQLVLRISLFFANRKFFKQFFRLKHSWVL